MGHRVITVPMPEAGGEQLVGFWRRHNCPTARALRTELGDEAPSDEVEFSVGLFGAGMPAYTPFRVVSTQPCGACNAYLGLMFQWAAPKIYLP